MSEEHNSIIDLVRNEKENLPRNEKAWQKKYSEWKKRDWLEWLNTNLLFPFTAQRYVDEDSWDIPDTVSDDLFKLGHLLKVLSLENEIDMYGIIVKVREKRETAILPLCDLEVVSEKDRNYWPVREYLEWFSNR